MSCRGRIPQFFIGLSVGEGIFPHSLLVADVYIVPGRILVALAAWHDSLGKGAIRSIGLDRSISISGRKSPLSPKDPVSAAS